MKTISHQLHCIKLILLSAEHANRNASFEFLVHELPTRWMQILKEMRTLPIEATAGMVEIQDSIEKSIEEVLPYTQEGRIVNRL